MTKKSNANLNAIESYPHLTVDTKEKLEKELLHIKFTQKGLNGRAKRIQNVLDTIKVKKEKKAKK